MSNLILLCISCHSKHHEESERPLQPQIKRKVIEDAIKNNQILHIDYRSESLGGI
jgi:hypothetical protein